LVYQVGGGQRASTLPHRLVHLAHKVAAKDPEQSVQANPPPARGPAGSAEFDVQPPYISVDAVCVAYAFDQAFNLQ
jgi:hypothetical protein